jgi:hypothetical protein
MVCMEIYKLIQPSKSKIEDYRCFSCNLALPILSSAEPIAPAKSKSVLKSGEWQWSLWDRIEIDEGDITLEQLMEHFKEKYGLEVTMLSHGASMIYYNFGVGLKKKVVSAADTRSWLDLVQSRYTGRSRLLSVLFSLVSVEGSSERETLGSREIRRKCRFEAEGSLPDPGGDGAERSRRGSRDPVCTSQIPCVKRVGTIAVTRCQRAQPASPPAGERASVRVRSKRCLSAQKASAARVASKSRNSRLFSRTHGTQAYIRTPLASVAAERETSVASRNHRCDSMLLRADCYS